MIKLILGVLLLLIIIFIYTGLGVLTREIFADKKCDVCVPPPKDTSATTKASETFNNITEGFSNNAVKLDLNEHELVFSKGAIVLLWIIVIIATITSVSAIAVM
jgi:hypothetical protein